MQQITQDYLANKAKELLNSGICSRVFGWKRGEFDYDLTPAVFTTAEQIDREFVYNGFCAANFSKYLVNETRRDAGKVAVFLKPCDSYSFNQLLTEHRFDREKVYAVGIPCEGMTDINKVRQAVDGIAKLTFDENGNIIVETLYDGTATLDRNECMLERCIHCKSKRCVVYDELLGENGEVLDDSRFDEVKKLEAMTADERFASGRVSFRAAFAAMPAAMHVLHAPAKNACLTIPHQVLKTKQPQILSKKKCFI